MSKFAFIADGEATVPGLEVIDLRPYPIDVPLSLIPGMQVALDPDWSGGYALKQYPSDHPVTAWRSKYAVEMPDAVSALKWNDPAGTSRSYAMRYNSQGTQTGLPVLGSTTINGKKAVTMSIRGQYAFLCGDPADTVANPAFLTPNYTIALVSMVEVGAIGGIFGEVPLLRNDEAASGLRLGFNNNGKTLYQHRTTSGNFIEVNRDICNAKPTLTVITCQGNAGNIHIKNSGVVSDDAFSFNSGAIADSTSRFCIGNLGAADDKNRHVGLFIRWNRKLTTAELATLYSWIETAKGPF